MPWPEPMARAQGRWLSAAELEQATKGGQYALHSQSVPALCQKFAANVETASLLRRQEFAESGHPQTEYPHHDKPYQTLVWKDQALQLLPTGQRPPLLLPLPAEYHAANLRRVELTWRADHYELCLTLDSGAPLPPPLPAGAVARVDLGEVHIAAVTTTCRHALVLSGRQVRSCKQWRNKAQQGAQRAAGAAEPLPARLTAGTTTQPAQSPGERQTLPPAAGPPASGGAQGRGFLRARGCQSDRRGGCA